MTAHVAVCPPVPHSRVARKGRVPMQGEVIQSGVLASRVKWDGGRETLTHNASLRTVPIYR
jgi:hypothetical protein